MNSMKVRAVIIEDELPAARLLDGMLCDLRPDWDVEILPGNIEDAVRWFGENKHPDIVFLDIQLTDGNSFLFIEQARPESMIVFTTAYDEYAVRAFTVNSIDYLLKPIHKERLLDSIIRFEKLNKNNIQYYNDSIDLKSLFNSLYSQTEKKYRTRFLISRNEKYFTLQVSDIAYFFSESKTTFAVTLEGKTHIIDMPLNKLEEQLDVDKFFRVSRQFILSVDCIRKVEPYFLGKVLVEVIPSCDRQIVVSRERVAAFKLWLNY